MKCILFNILCLPDIFVQTVVRCCLVEVFYKEINYNFSFFFLGKG